VHEFGLTTLINIAVKNAFAAAVRNFRGLLDRNSKVDWITFSRTSIRSASGLPPLLLRTTS